MTKERRSPGTARATSTTLIADSQSNAPWHKDWKEPLTAADRADFDVLDDAAAERGFRLAVQCTRCKQWLTAPSSVRRHLGPVCHAKAVTE